MQRKILVLSNNCSGLVNFRREVLEAFAKQGYTLIVAAPEDFKTYIIKEMGCKFINFKFNRRGMNPFADMCLFVKYWHLLHCLKPDIVLTYTIKPNLYGGMACRLTKTNHLANITGLGIAAEKKGLIKTIIYTLYKIGLKKANAVFLQNKHDLSYCISHKLINDRSILLPGSGVNLDKFKQQEYPISKIIKFIFIGRIQKRKGIDLYIEAARIIKKEFPDTEFHVLGRCEDVFYQRILSSLEKKGYVKYHGFTDDVRPFLKDIHCTVHPSYYNEGMSNVLLESCATGRPVITTNKAGCADIVVDGKNGYIMDKIDTESLVRLIKLFISLPYQTRKEMGNYARKKMEEEYDRQIVVNQYLATVSQITNTKNKLANY